MAFFKGFGSSKGSFFCFDANTKRKGTRENKPIDLIECFWLLIDDYESDQMKLNSHLCFGSLCAQLFEDLDEFFEILFLFARTSRCSARESFPIQFLLFLLIAT